MSKKDLINKKADILLKAGKMLLKSMADCNRIERNLKRIAFFLNIKEDEFSVYITYTSITITINSNEQYVSKFVQCKEHSPDMRILTDISKLSWTAIKENMSIKQFGSELDKINKNKLLYQRWFVISSVSLACGAFCKLFGSDNTAVLITLIAATTGYTYRYLTLKCKMNNYISIMTSAFIASLTAGGLSGMNLTDTPHHPVIACVIFLIPGVPLLNSADDLFDGHTIVGFTRALSSLLALISIAIGMIFALNICGLSLSTEVEYVQNAYIPFAAAVVSAGNAVLFNVQRRYIVWCAAGGILSVILKNCLMENLSPTAAVFCTAISISLLSVLVTRTINIPLKVIAVPSIIPLLPGVAMYHTMMGIIELASAPEIDNLLVTVQSGINSVMIISAITLGITIPNVLRRKHYKQRFARFVRKIGK